VKCLEARGVSWAKARGKSPETTATAAKMDGIFREIRQVKGKLECVGCGVDAQKALGIKADGF
jgi:hypothetical protein